MTPLVIGLIVSIWILIITLGLWLGGRIERAEENILARIDEHGERTVRQIRSDALRDAADLYDSMEEQQHLKIVAQTFDPRGERSLPAHWMLERSVMEADL